MFKTLGRIAAALKRAGKREETKRALDNLPPETQKDIGWSKSPSDEIRLPF
ncbi:hypothetical protein [Mesorhizobium amorphae]|uniref:Uncharacterized protein n=1 Tax=Mesorhizobium amorphae CCNWGS0123 TaxID=1082933 RepID=G6YIQ0_9HYPH|nr:hypothetical protein [Mesorhizobium amorphae]EHH05855.1 hypothetical protein MEA186_29377 [Mesorhizobium amorphae CCNWGS0123]GLR42649.1 hypothetical protein GCM10007880_31650 [Mesorhizobium amorphae]